MAILHIKTCFTNKLIITAELSINMQQGALHLLPQTMRIIDINNTNQGKTTFINIQPVVQHLISSTCFAHIMSSQNSTSKFTKSVGKHKETITCKKTLPRTTTLLGLHHKILTSTIFFFASLGLVYLFARLSYLTFEFNLLFFFLGLFGALTEKERNQPRLYMHSFFLLLRIHVLMTPTCPLVLFFLFFTTGLHVSRPTFPFPEVDFRIGPAASTLRAQTLEQVYLIHLTLFKFLPKVPVKNQSITFSIGFQWKPIIYRWKAHFNTYNFHVKH